MTSVFRECNFLTQFKSPECEIYSKEVEIDSLFCALEMGETYQKFD